MPFRLVELGLHPGFSCGADGVGLARNTPVSLRGAGMASCDATLHNEEERTTVRPTSNPKELLMSNHVNPFMTGTEFHPAF